jgi:hypothetical protein
MKVNKYEDYSQRLTIQLLDCQSLQYYWIKRKIIKQFQLKSVSDEQSTVNEIFQSYISSKGKISIDWDNWSGLTVTALNKESEELLLKIEQFLRDKYEVP